MQGRCRAMGGAAGGCEVSIMCKVLVQPETELGSFMMGFPSQSVVAHQPCCPPQKDLRLVE